jgi:acyl-CoA dehydrogenase
VTAATPHPVPDAHGTNFFEADPTHAALCRLYLGEALYMHLSPHLSHLGGLAGGTLDDWANVADHHPPVLRARTRTGEDRQSVQKHPSYVAMEQVAFADYGLAAMSHRPGVLGWPAPLPPAAKYALSYLFVQAEFGLCCPLSMTDALARTLSRFGSSELVGRYLPGLTATDLDSLTQGAMFMTEQGAGSDVGATATVAEPDGDAWRLTGDKWFCSNPDAGVALVLARRKQADGDTVAGTAGLSLFLLPRVLPDGRMNDYQIVRLKDKMGSRSMASGEIRLTGARAYLVGEAAQGFKQMADMINTSRLSNGMRAAGMMRRAAFEARFVAEHRMAFGQRLADMPLVQRQLSKIDLLAENARSMVFFAAWCLERADGGQPPMLNVEPEVARRALRIVTPLLKFRACRDARRATGDAMEMRGGVGYIEEFSDARLVRDAHLGSIWEGTSNIVAGDVLRATVREGALAALRETLAALEAAAGGEGASVSSDASTSAELKALWERAAAFVEHTAKHNDTAHTRQAASGLYYATAARVMAWEAGQLSGSLGLKAFGEARLALAYATAQHKLQVRDPLRAALDGAPEVAPDVAQAKSRDRLSSAAQVSAQAAPRAVVPVSQ